MILYQYGQRVEQMPSDISGYFLPDDMQYALSLLSQGNWSPEVNLINMLRSEYFNDKYDKNFIDIGASVGTYTLSFAGNFGHTYSFEPNKHVYNILCGNVAMANLSYKTTLTNAAIHSSETDLMYHNVDELGGENYVTESEGFDNDTPSDIRDFEHTYVEQIRKTKIHVNTLDSYGIENVGFIKIDVEGNEVEVIKGAYDTIEKSGFPPMLIENWVPSKEPDFEIRKAMEDKRKDLYERITSMGYSVIEYNEGELLWCTNEGFNN